MPAGRRPTRRELLAAGGAGLASGSLMATAPASAAALAKVALPPRIVDADRLKRLLSVELLILYCYDHVLSTSLLKPRARRLLLPLRGHEQAHVKALSTRLSALGGSPPQPPSSLEQANRDLARRRIGGRLGRLQGDRDALYLLLALEQVVIGAYFVALTKLEDPHLMRLAAEIMASDAQHEALVGEALYPGQTGYAVPYGLVQGIQ